MTSKSSQNTISATAPTYHENMMSKTNPSLFQNRNQRSVDTESSQQRPRTTATTGNGSSRSSNTMLMREVVLPISINLAEKYEPQYFETTLRKTFKTKFDEELHKIKERTDVMLRDTEQATRQHNDFEFHRTQEMIGYEKRIPKQAIMHKIERFHRAKFPSFSIDKCLQKKVRALPDNASRFDIRLYEEKKIDADLSRKSALVRQQDIIKQGLTLQSRQTLGFAPTLPTKEQYYSEEDSALDDDSDQFVMQNNNPQAQQQVQKNDHVPSKKILLNRHAHPCNSSYHDDESIERRQWRSTRTTARTSPTQEESPSLNYNLWRKTQQLSQNSTLASQYANETTPFFHLRRKRAVSSLQSSGQFQDASALSYVKVDVSSAATNQSQLKENIMKPSTAGMISQNRTNCLPNYDIDINSVSNQSFEDPNLIQFQKELVKKAKIERKREQRQQSPLNYLFNKYSQLVQSDEVQSYAMKKLTGIYIKGAENNMNNSIYRSYAASVESSPKYRPTGFKFNQIKQKEPPTQSSSPQKQSPPQLLLLKPKRNTERTTDNQQSQSQQQVDSPFTNKFDFFSHHNDLVQTLKDFKREQKINKQVTATAAASQHSSPAKSRSPTKNNNIISTNNENSQYNISPPPESARGNANKQNSFAQITQKYDNSRGQYNVSDFLKRVQEEKQAQIEREKKGQRQLKKQSTSKPESPQRNHP